MIEPSAFAGGSVIPVAAVLIVTAAFGYCAVFKGRKESPRGTRGSVSQNSTACPAPSSAASHHIGGDGKRALERELAEPGSVDMLGRTAGGPSHKPVA